MNLDDVHALEVADVRYPDLERGRFRRRIAGNRALRRCRPGLGRGPGRVRIVIRRSGCGLLCGLGRRRRLAVPGGAQGQDDGAFGNATAGIQGQRDHRSSLRSRHVHRGLLRFQGYQRILGGDLVTRLDVHLDDFHVREVADVGYPDFDIVCHAVVPPIRR